MVEIVSSVKIVKKWDMVGIVRNVNDNKTRMNSVHLLQKSKNHATGWNFDFLERE